MRWPGKVPIIAGGARGQGATEARMLIRMVKYMLTTQEHKHGAVAIILRANG